jgi:hypothetical protein
MPPRHTYWTILFGDKPTAFRSATQEELLPTFKQIQAKHADAVMMWFARGKLWRSEEEARAAFERPRFDRPSRPPQRDEGQRPAWQNRDRPPGDRPRGPKPEWLGPPKPRSGEGGRERPQGDRPRGPKPEWQNRGPKPEWRPGPPPASPKSRSDEDGRDEPRGDRPRGPKPEWSDKPQGDRPTGPRPPAFTRKPAGPGYGEAPFKPGGRGGDWKNRGGDGAKPAWRDRPQGDRPRGPKPDWQNRGPKPEWRPGPPPASPKSRSDEGGRDKPQGDRPSGPRPDCKNRSGGGAKPAWRDKPQGDRPRGPRPEWKPRDDKPRSGEGKPAGAPPADDKRGRDWRPGGQHKDPRDRFKVPRDVKRARFKDKLRRDRTGPPTPRKKKDEE